MHILCSGFCKIYNKIIKGNKNQLTKSVFGCIYTLYTLESLN